MPSVIRIENLSKSYRIAPGQPRAEYRTLRETLSDLAAAPWRRLRGGAKRGRAEEFWALKDVNLDVQQGEVVGIIGRNGAGKSTLLKILSRVTAPTRGQVELRGRVGSLLEVGTGFHPELTGRENIYLNGSILGMTRREIQRKFEAIVAFSGVERFLDTPVKRYSSGMHVRLAFAVAAHLEPEILFIDEVLAVGDVAFQSKCLAKMQDISAGGRTILFVSHNMPAIRNLTTRCVYLDGGGVAFSGPTAAAIDRYLAHAAEQVAEQRPVNLNYFRRRALGSDAPVRFRRVWITGGNCEGLATLQVGEDFQLHCEVECSRAYAGVVIAFWLTNQLGERVATVFSQDRQAVLPLKPGAQTFSCLVRQLPLSPGRYSITVGVNETANTTAFDVLVDYPAFEVVMPQRLSGLVEWPNRPWGAIHWPSHEWSVSHNGTQ